MMRNATFVALVGSLALGLMACEKQGTGERVGEEIDEAVDTAKHGGEESVGTKVDDAVDQAREDAKDIGEAAKNN